jgi:hypothetical protein
MPATRAQPARAFMSAMLCAAVAQCGGPTSPSRFEPPLAEVIEAIFLGSGPLAAGGCPAAGIWATYPRASVVTLIVSSSIDSSGRQSLAAAVNDLNAAFTGRFELTVSPTSVAAPLPGGLEITTDDISSAEILTLCSPGASGCTRVTFHGVLLDSARAVQMAGTSLRVKTHELGHAVGLCHVNRYRMPAAVQAIRQVYSSAIQPGARREDFLRAGLVR